MAERPEDLNLPNAVITRIIKEALPDGVNVSKEARRAISQAASVFVLYATSCANNFAMKAKRKTLNAGDVLAAMEEMEFERFLEPLREALEGNDVLAKRPANKKPTWKLSSNGHIDLQNVSEHFIFSIISVLWFYHATRTVFYQITKALQHLYLMIKMREQQ